jgi:hypothetical protein
MSEAAPNQTAPAETQAPTNDNATGSAPVAANDNAQPTGAQQQALEQAVDDGTLSVEALAKLMSGKKIPIKVNGKDRLVDAAQFARLAQIGYGGFQKATQYERSFKDFESAFESDPIDALDRWAAKNPKIAAALEARAEREARLHNASPEDRKRIEQEYALQERERRIKEHEAAQEEARKQAEQQAQQEKAQKAAQAMTRFYGKCMADAGIDKDDQPVAYDMMLRRHQALLDEGIRPTPDNIRTIAKQVGEYIDGLASRRAKRWDAAALEERLGKDKLREFQRLEAEKVRSPRDTGGRFATTTPPETPVERKKVRYGNSMASWQRARNDAGRK